MMEYPVILRIGSLLKVKLSVHCPGSLEFLHPVCLDLLWSPFVVFVSVVQDRIVSHILLDLVSVGSNLWVLVENVVQLLLIEIEMGSLLQQLTGYNLVFNASLLSLHIFNKFLILKVYKADEISIQDAREEIKYYK